MKLYAISGLGADSRVFDYLKLDYELIPIEWIKPKRDETIEAYALRLSKVINTNEEYGILGVSFGGLAAVEMSKVLKPRLTILISSAATKNELRPILSWIGKMGIVKWLPKKLFDPPRILAHYLFGTSKKELLNNILDDTDLGFAKWAVNELLNWKNEQKLDRVLKISGTNDKLIPPTNDTKIHLIEHGGHFMIVDKAEEMSRVINVWIRDDD